MHGITCEQTLKVSPLLVHHVPRVSVTVTVYISEFSWFKIPMNALKLIKIMIMHHAHFT